MAFDLGVPRAVRLLPLARGLTHRTGYTGVR